MNTEQAAQSALLRPFLPVPSHHTKSTEYDSEAPEYTICNDCKYFKDEGEIEVDTSYMNAGQRHCIPHGTANHHRTMRGVTVTMCQHKICFGTTLIYDIRNTARRIRGQAQLSRDMRCNFYRRPWWKFWLPIHRESDEAPKTFSWNKNVPTDADERDHELLHMDRHHFDQASASQTSNDPTGMSNPPIGAAGGHVCAYVETASSLPLTGNNDGDTRVVQDEDSTYEWVEAGPGPNKWIEVTHSDGPEGDSRCAIGKAMQDGPDQILEKKQEAARLACRKPYRHRTIRKIGGNR